MKWLISAIGLTVALLSVSACQSEATCATGVDCTGQVTGGPSPSKNVRSISQALRADGLMVSEVAAAGSFSLFAGGTAAPLFVSAQDHAGVVRAAGDLQGDVLKVSGVEPTLTTSDVAVGPTAVLIGTLGMSPLIDDLVAAGKLDASLLSGKWETFVIQAVDQPVAGVDQALVIAGSDKRGTIYGIYELSEEMGVSPWHYWADVPPRSRTELHVSPGVHTMGEPAVKYRGLFINDENPALYDWYREAFSSSSRGFESDFYVHVFELILRMKGNYLWPAMWGKTFNTDDVDNPRLADEYGVVMGTSHHEPLTRAEQEWYDAGEDESGWSYATNAAALEAFWQGGIERMGDRETMVTVGMRGSGDIPNPDQGIPLLESVVSAQRQIIADVTGKDASQTPQVWTLYKEVQGYYDGGMQVPDDVTLMFADDNWGNIRRLPSASDQARSGGYGVYYHFDYVGGPRSYRWLNTNPIPRVWEQMRRAHSLGADRIWIVNVGDIKPMEYPLQFFMDLAWDPDGWTVERLADYPRRWAKAQFGETHAEEIGALVSAYSKFNGRRKPELLSADTYSLENFREADTVVEEYNALIARAEAVEAQLPPESLDAFFQLVLHPILACANLNEMYVSQAKNGLYATQGRGSTDAMADRVDALFDNDSAIADRYHSINGGKWNHMMKQTHIGYTSWDNPATQVRPSTQRVGAGSAGLGVALEGTRNALSAGSPAGQLPELSVYYPEEDRRIEIFNRGAGSLDFSAQSDVAYVTVEPSSGTITEDTTLTLTVDWTQVPLDGSLATLTITGPDGDATVELPLNNPTTPRPEDVVGFVEANGYVSLDAAHYTEKVDGNGVGWAQVPDLGRTGSAVHIQPANAGSVIAGGSSPQLHYKMHFFEAGQVQVRVYLSPSLPVNSSHYRYALSMDDGALSTVDIHEGLPADFNDSAPVWEGWVSDNSIVKTSTLNVAAPGEHTLKLWMVDAGVVVQKIVVEQGQVPVSYLGPPSRMPLNVEVDQVIPDRGPMEGSDEGTGGGSNPGAGGGATDPAAGGSLGVGVGGETGGDSGGGNGLPTDPTTPGAGGVLVGAGGTSPADPTSGGETPEDSSGCSCSTVGGRSPAAPLTGGALLLLGAALLRHRRRGSF